MNAIEMIATNHMMVSNVLVISIGKFAVQALQKKPMFCISSVIYSVRVCVGGGCWFEGAQWELVRAC